MRSKEKFVRLLIYSCLFLVTFSIEFLSINILNFQVSFFRIMISITVFFGIIFKIKEIIKIDKSLWYYFVFMICWIAYAIVSILWVMNKFEWFQTIYFISLGLLSLWIFYKYITNKKYLFNSFMFFSFSGIIHVLIGLNEVFFKNYLFIKEEYLQKYMYNNWPVSTFTNTNNYAFYLGLSLCVFFFIFKYTKKVSVKLFYFIVSIVALLLVCSTESRGVVLALIVGISFLLLNKHALYNKTKQFNIILVSSAMVFLSLVIILSVVAFNNVEHFQNQLESNSIRLNLTFNSFYLTIKSYFIGVGAGNFEYYITNYALFETAGIVNSHNWWLEILTEYGIIIFLGYIQFIIFLYIETQKRYKYDKFVDEFQYITTFFLVVFSIGCVSPSSILEMQWLWGMFAVIIAGVKICSNYEVDKGENLIFN